MEKLKNNSLNIISIFLLCFCVVLLINQIKINNSVLTYMTEKINSSIRISWYEEESTTTYEATVQELITENTEVINKETTLKNNFKKFVINKSSKKFHNTDCSYANSMKDENKQITEVQNAEELKKNGYSPCSSCLK